MVLMSLWGSKREVEQAEGCGHGHSGGSSMKINQEGDYICNILMNISEIYFQVSRVKMFINHKNPKT